MVSYFLRIDRYFPLIFIIRSFDDEFRSIFGAYPVFHRKSVTKGKLLTLLAILIIFEITLTVMSVNDFVVFFSFLQY
jgi:hypothetical protein